MLSLTFPMAKILKGQMKPKAVWARHRFSQKMNKQICFVRHEKQKQTNQVHWFIFGGESMVRQSAFGFI